MKRGRRIARTVKRLIARGDLNAEPVILRWRDRPAGNYDPILDAGNPAFAGTEKSQELRAFVHQVSVGTTAFQRFSEVRAGDIILDFPGDARVGNEQDGFREIDSLAALEFEIAGSLYVQKNGGEELAKCWDVRVGGVPVTRTILVTPKG